MRRHPKATSSRSNPRKPSGLGSALLSGRLRLTILLAAAAAFLLLPAAQAFAGGGPIKINLAGTGKGEVNNLGGLGGGGTGSFTTTPTVECSNIPGEEAAECEVKFEGSQSNAFVRAKAAPGSVFAGYTVVNANYEEFGTCNSTGGPPNETEESVEAFDAEGGFSGRPCVFEEIAGKEAEITVTFNKEPGFLLTVKKIGEGTIVSNPGGIECGPTCAKSFEGKVTLTANPASGYIFKRWIGCTKTTEGTGPKGHTCTVEMTKAMEVKAEFVAVNALTLNKGGTGSGTVTSAPGGISCTPSCTSNVAVFETTKTVLLKASPLTSTSEFEKWEGCESEPEGKCSVAMSKAQSVVAKFKPIPQFVLTLTKAGGGTGTVASSPAGISCGTTCSSGEASYQKGKVVSLKQTAASGSSFGGWTGCESESEGKCIVAMTKAQSVTATFK